MGSGSTKDWTVSVAEMAIHFLGEDLEVFGMGLEV
jgi:hypothetical protein